MENIFLKAYAKINLNLHLIPELYSNGYYRVQFLNSQLDIFDQIKITKNYKNRINISILKGENLISDASDLNIQAKDNLAYRAADLIIEKYKIKTGVDIEIKKNIPVKAGLGGGSCDAAGIINGMNKLFSLNLTPIQKINLAKNLGMDVCYCVIGRLCLVGGIGDIVIPLPYLIPKTNNVLLVTPRIKKPSTAWAYSVIKETDIGKNLNKLDGLLKGIITRNSELIFKNIWNDFEKPISRHFPIITEITDQLKKYGAYASTLAGSGLTVFGIFKEKSRMTEAKNNLKRMGYEVIQTSII